MEEKGGCGRKWKKRKNAGAGGRLSMRRTAVEIKNLHPTRNRRASTFAVTADLKP